MAGKNRCSIIFGITNESAYHDDLAKCSKASIMQFPCPYAV